VTQRAAERPGLPHRIEPQREAKASEPDAATLYRVPDEPYLAYGEALGRAATSLVHSLSLLSGGRRLASGARQLGDVC